MNRYLIDTNIVIYTLNAKDKFRKVIDFIDRIYDDDQADILYSVVVEAEIFSRKIAKEILKKIDLLLSEARIVKIDSVIARKAGEIRASGKALGYNIKLPDALIAATAIIENAILVTHNQDDFFKIKNIEKLNIYDPMGKTAPQPKAYM